MVSSVTRRTFKTIDTKPSVSFPIGQKHRRKVFSYSFLAILVAGFIFLRAPISNVLQPKRSAYHATTRVSVNGTAEQVVSVKDKPETIPVLKKNQHMNEVKGEPKGSRAYHSLSEEESEGVSAPSDHGRDDHVSERTPNDKEHESLTLTKGEPGKCLEHILYDKPVKTGSTAIMFAIRKYLKETRRWDHSCSSKVHPTCVDRGNSVCDGSVKEEERFSIIGHFRFATKQLVDCLRPNYYYVTSVRDPYQRRKSAYLWNRTLNATHFAIPYTASFSEFMEKLPRCQLYHYYDGRGKACDVGMPLEQRIQEIVDRVDEVIDIYDEPVGPLHRLIAKYLERENESIKIEEKEYLEDFDRDTLKEEQMLYERLRKIRMRTPDPNRLPC